jgi:hypothetical protein
LSHFLEVNLPGYHWEDPWQDPVPNEGIPVVKAVLTVLTYLTSATEMLKASVAFTGDVDTVAALVLAAASQHPDVTWDLPDSLLENLEPGGKFGAEYLQQMDVALESAYPKPEAHREDVDLNELFDMGDL